MVLAGAALLAFHPAWGSEKRTPQSGRKLIIGTREAPPFSMKAEDGSWQGLGIDLWRDMAEEMNLDYEFREMGIQALITGVQEKQLDAAVAALTITARREKLVDFTHPFYASGLGIAVRAESKGGWNRIFDRFLSYTFIRIVASLALSLLVVGVLIWLFERKGNPGQFGRGFFRGIGAGFWWAAVTMTTVGYGDKSPTSLPGRLVAMVWMFASVITISSFTAAITTALTLTRLEPAIRGPEDLVRSHVGTVPGSTSETYLAENWISHKNYPALPDGLHALIRGEVDAVVYDVPILRYLKQTQFGEDIDILPVTFEDQYYGIALPVGSRLREPLNQFIPEYIRQKGWQDILFQHMGR
ncbi:hypothetical protein DENIS_3277 [Desulfonema ishimotonii]|uniref:ABC transporter substrate-binding protein n=2 Tax=Desulfonema ishimotonii TaxID=45657 RepID=A0A401FZC4_9BACT|nr:hypothetical protein DENIS_3277 [Desulfonema ishimotonii]